MATQLIRSIHSILPSHRGGVVTLGNFDGVHLGHQKLIQQVVKAAKLQAYPSLAITFEPHPFEFFNSQTVGLRLTRMREKLDALAQYGLDYLLVMKFNQKLADLSASEFVDQVLCQALSIRQVIVGDDFQFGKKRQGDLNLLKQLGEKNNFKVEAMPSFALQGQRVSSTWVRQVLAAGNLAQARTLLGRPYRLIGRIQKGDQRGRQFGFPTANIFLPRELTSLKGVYTVFVEGISEHPLPGVANLGVRPTVGGSRLLLEIHLLNFDADIYGRRITITFAKKLRDEIQFANINKLIEQIKNDVAQAQDYFQQTQGFLDA